MTAVLRVDEARVQRFYELAGAARWATSRTSFAEALAASVERAYPDTPPSGHRLDAYLRALHLEDLALACACADGHEQAWEHFVLTYRPVLYRAADASGHGLHAREIADSLYGELYGIARHGDARQSLFRYFHGRSGLGTWLRAVFSQRLVDSLRRASRLDPLPEDESPRALTLASPERAAPVASHLEAVQRVMAAAIAVLAPRDRLRLRSYYAQDLTLAQIGQLTGEHEATVSRNLSRTRRQIRQDVESRLTRDEHWSAAQISERLAAAADDAGPLDLAVLLGPADPGPPVQAGAGPIVQRKEGAQ